MESYSLLVLFYSFLLALLGFLAIFFRYFRGFKNKPTPSVLNTFLLKSNHAPIPTDSISLFILRHSSQKKIHDKNIQIFYHPYEPPEGTSTSFPTEEIPTLLFLHGIGGNMDQFSELIYLFKSNAHLLTLDYVGHGLTPDTKNPSHYTTQALLSDIVEVLRCHVKSHHRASTDLIDSTMPTPTADFKKIPLMIISHSYGCVLATKLASYLKEGALMDYELRSMAFIAPSYRAPWPKAKYIPLWVLSLLRQWDQRGGSDSNSVRRLLGATADKRLKRKQFIWNRHLSTQQLGYLLEGLEWPTDTLYEHMKVPVFVLGGALDHLVPPSHLTALSALVACKDGPVIIPGLGHQLVCQAPEVVHAHVSSFLTQFCPQFYPYTHWTMDSRDKWNLKNLSKWKSTVPMGHVLARLVPMKVLKQDDPEHNPSTLAKLHPELRCIVDLSKDSPPYDTEELSKLGIRYIKVSTVSKQVPTFENVQHFIQVVDDYLTKNPFQIGVHCHYGYNRTGFMIVSYLVEKLGMDVHDAIHAFTAARKPDGIRHLHFKDELYLRYAPHQRLELSK